MSALELTLRIYDEGGREPHLVRTVPVKEIHNLLEQHACDGDRYNIRYHNGPQAGQLALHEPGLKVPAEGNWEDDSI